MSWASTACSSVLGLITPRNNSKHTFSRWIAADRHKMLLYAFNCFLMLHQSQLLERAWSSVASHWFGKFTSLIRNRRELSESGDQIMKAEMKDARGSVRYQRSSKFVFALPMPTSAYRILWMKNLLLLMMPLHYHIQASAVYFRYVTAKRSQREIIKHRKHDEKTFCGFSANVLWSKRR